MRLSAALLVVLVFLAASCPTLSLPIKAEHRTITVPDDYLTIQEAIGNATAGDTILVKRGTYEEQTLVINKTISLIGEDANNTAINLHPPWIPTGGYTMNAQPEYGYDNPIKIQASDVEISGFTINSNGGAISISGNRTQIIGNIIKTALNIDGGSHQSIAENTLTNGINSYGSYSSITSNKITESNQGIRVGGFSNMVYGNSVSRVSKVPGISLHGDGNIIAKNTVIDSQSGLVCVLNDAGSNNFVYSNKLISNVYGLQVDGGNNNTFYANDLINNSIGVRIGSSEILGKTTILLHNNFVDSIQQVSKSPSDTAGYFDNGEEGNYWSDYNGTDANGDGVGDTPYIIGGNLQDRCPLMAPVDISSVPLELPKWPEPRAEPFPTALVVVSIASVAAVASLGLLVYLKKLRRFKSV